ncbi:MAG TPA: sugar transferase [Clostridiaceae bacterium]|jgi:exopolysaccharide biosynthesis polyprenyl glycosylphosphotransferase|nr:sugar transferase [Clostridiaceae bacterium]HBG37969.1 sugar transferase [Clostridiaceae bacterium]HBN29354.1 sugar transferase [Clostridiaceae bacterium]HBX48271.1 sugar transferase [Clostridiaceae bacterium]HCL50345.1 sugar transferase [Clostridiaceae bacterium]
MESEKIINEIKSELNHKRIQLLIKRFFDIVFSIFLLILLSPLFLILIIWISIDSPGGAIFKQIRVGKDGEEFTIYKFRSMVKNADKMFNKEVNEDNKDTFVFQEKDDPRITRSGKFLRKTSLDELPQLINIIKGDMSLIGPRPEIQEIVKSYSDRDKIRLLMKPGVSGLAQVNGRGNLELSETINYDIEYIEKFSLAMDFKIFFKTIKVVFTREGAY